MIDSTDSTHRRDPTARAAERDRLANDLGFLLARDWLRRVATDASDQGQRISTDSTTSPSAKSVPPGTDTK